MGNKNNSKSSNSFQNSSQLQSENYPAQYSYNGGRHFGSRQVEEKYNDDEEITSNEKKIFEQSSESNYDLEKGLSLEIKAMHKHFQFNKSQNQIIPVMVSVKTLDKTQESNIKVKKAPNSQKRANIDLVCVIDHSGSMSGSKMESVKNTLKYLLDLLCEDDRISLILFNTKGTRLCPLKRTSEQNRNKLNSLIDSINARDGTNINSGMELALKVLRDRKQQNPVSSIFLLSDGQDQRAREDVKASIDKYLPNDCFTIHSFGFGNDHDAPLMNHISSLKDGNFYYVEKVNQVDEFFIDVLGALFSVIVQDVVIDVQLNMIEKYPKYFAKSFVQKTFGEMWGTVKKNHAYQIRINQLLSGVSKDFIFEIQVPASSIEMIEDFERNVEIVTATASAIPIDQTYSTKVIKNANLVWTLFTNSEVVADDSEPNENVEFNYLRVKATEAIDEAMKQAEKQQYDNSQQILGEMLNVFEKSNSKNQDRLQVIKRDLIECQVNSKPRVYEDLGRFKMISKRNANIKQISQAVQSEDLYCNSVQREMVSKARAKKGI